jgi:SPP1 family predicted phage head-tail adaptor
MSVFASLLNNDFAIRRIRRTSNGQGGWSEDTVAVATVRGRLRPASGAEREAAMLEERQITHVLYVVAGVDIARGDTVTGGGLTVEVQGVREPSQAGEHLEIDCRERQFEVSAEEEAGS